MSMDTMMNQEESTTTNYSRTSLQTSARRMLLKVKMRSIKESEGSRKLSKLSTDGTRKPAHGTHRTAKTSTVLSLQLMIPVQHFDRELH
jgi:hypothetical protein